MINYKSVNAYNAINDYLSEKDISRKELLNTISKAPYNTVKDISKTLHNTIMNCKNVDDYLIDIAYIHNDVDDILRKMDFVDWCVIHYYSQLQFQLLFL